MNISGVARAFPGGRVAHSESQNEKNLRKNNKNWSKFEGKWGKLEILPTRDCEAGYGPDEHDEDHRIKPSSNRFLSYVLQEAWSCYANGCQTYMFLNPCYDGQMVSEIFWPNIESPKVKYGIHARSFLLSTAYMESCPNSSHWIKTSLLSRKFVSSSWLIFLCAIVSAVKSRLCHVLEKNPHICTEPPSECSKWQNTLSIFASFECFVFIYILR